MILRPYQATDLEPLAGLFTASVHALAAGHYSAAQLDAWAPRPPDPARWLVRLAPLQTVVAQVGAALAGFIAYEPEGRIVYLYVAPGFAHQGVATRLCDEVESRLRAQGVAELGTEASLAARPFFERRGYAVVEEQQVEFGGARFRRLAMRKVLGGAAPGGQAAPTAGRDAE